MPVHPDANKSRLPTVKKASPEKKNRQEETAQMKEEKTPPVSMQSTVSPSVPTDSQEASAIKELTEENPVYAPEQQPQAHTLDALSSPEFILLEAASQGDVATGERLLSTGIVPDVADERGWTALMMATVHGYSPMVELLLKKSADVNRNNGSHVRSEKWTYHDCADSVKQRCRSRFEEYRRTNSAYVCNRQGTSGNSASLARRKSRRNHVQLKTGSAPALIHFPFLFFSCLLKHRSALT
jgi:hypothetical protein